MNSENAEKIFGTGWQSKLARHIGMDSRQVRRWVAGDSPAPKLLILYLSLLASLSERTRKRWLNTTQIEVDIYYCVHCLVEKLDECGVRRMLPVVNNSTGDKS